MDEWSEVDPTSNLNLKGKRGENIIFFSQFLAIFEQWVELERERRETAPYLYDLWRLGGRNPSNQDLKFIYSTRATRGYRQHAISSRISCLEKKS